MINRASVKNKTVNAHCLITMDANFVNEILLVPKRAERRHEPAIAIIPLSYITGSSAFLIEDWVIEYILQWTVKSARGAKEPDVYTWLTDIRFTDLGVMSMSSSHSPSRQSRFLNLRSHSMSK